MFKVTLRRNDAPSYRTATIEFPALENELVKTLAGIGVGITTEKNCLVEQISGDGNSLQSLVGQCINADEMQYLAKRMDSFDKNEMQTFYAMASTAHPSTIKGLINLTFNLHCHCLVSDFSDIEQIGQHYELSRRMAIPMDEMKQIDFATIGRRVIHEGNGTITPYGVLYATGNQPEPVYNGEQFPEYSYRGDDVAVVTLEVGGYSEGIKYEYLYLPCWEVETQKALCRLGVDTLHPCATTLDCDAMSEAVHRIFTEDYPLSEHIDTLNHLARSYIGLDDAGKTAFHAIVDMVQPKAPEDVAVLADNFYEFIAVPGIKTPAEYGKSIIMDHSSYEVDERLAPYIDFKRYGEDKIRQECGSFTEYGYIAYRGTTPAVLELLRSTDTPTMTMGGLS